jgi:hypothetical protein
VFDHRHCRGVLEHPRREDLAPATGIITLAFDQNLHEGTGFLRHFPRRGPLAGRHADNDVTRAARFTRLHHQILSDIVALVEQADRGNTLDHRGCAFDLGGDARGVAGPQFLRDFGRHSLRLGRFAAAGRQRQSAEENRRRAHPQASGLHAS